MKDFTCLAPAASAHAELHLDLSLSNIRLLYQCNFSAVPCVQLQAHSSLIPEDPYRYMVHVVVGLIGSANTGCCSTQDNVYYNLGCNCEIVVVTVT